jgi:hypothetical protein
MASVLRERDGSGRCFATIKLDSGEQVMISVAQTGVQIFRMKWGGLMPAGILWESAWDGPNLMRIASRIADVEPRPRLLPILRDMVLQCPDTAAVARL